MIIFYRLKVVLKIIRKNAKKRFRGQNLIFSQPTTLAKCLVEGQKIEFSWTTTQNMPKIKAWSKLDHRKRKINMKLIKKYHTYKDKNGKEKKAVNFYLVVEGIQNPIAIEPKTFGDKGSTFAQLNWVAEYVKD